MSVLAGTLVGGLSVGGIETCIDLPRWKLCFDVGRCPDEAVKRPTVLFTHAHIDHMGGAAWHAATRSLRAMPPPTYVVPRENADEFAAMIDAWRRLDRSDLPHALVPLGPGEEHALPNGRLVRPFRSPHTAPCQGYGLWTRKHVLREEHRGLPGEEIARLRRAGAPVTRAVEEPEVAFSGDTRIELVEREEVVRRARLLILEVTFVDDRVSVEETRAHGHVHVDEVVERADLFENEALLLTHFSARYRPQEIVDGLRSRLPGPLLQRAHALVPDPAEPRYGARIVALA